jgi:hypothetical protein
MGSQKTFAHRLFAPRVKFSREWFTCQINHLTRQFINYSKQSARFLFWVIPERFYMINPGKESKWIKNRYGNYWLL